MLPTPSHIPIAKRIEKRAMIPAGFEKLRKAATAGVRGGWQESLPQVENEELDEFVVNGPGEYHEAVWRGPVVTKAGP